MHQRTALLPSVVTILVVAIGSGCRGAQIRELRRRLDQLEERNNQLESRVSIVEKRTELRTIPVTTPPEPKGN